MEITDEKLDYNVRENALMSFTKLLDNAFDIYSIDPAKLLGTDKA